MENPTVEIQFTNEGELVNLYKMSAAEEMNKVRQATTSANSKPRTWKEGDLCMAPYTEDGRWYNAKIIKLHGKQCRVCYTEYDEEGDVDVSQLLSESEVEIEDSEENGDEKMDTMVYERSTPSNKGGRQFPIPSICPPPLALFEKLSKASTEKESLTNMLMSWYMSGYHTGYYEGLKEGRSGQHGAGSNKRGGK